MFTSLFIFFFKRKELLFNTNKFYKYIWSWKNANITSGVKVINNFKSKVTTTYAMLCNNVLWLVKTSHVTWNIQSE